MFGDELIAVKIGQDRPLLSAYVRLSVINAPATDRLRVITEHGLRPEMYERVLCNLIHDLAFTTDHDQTNHDQTNNFHQAKK